MFAVSCSLSIFVHSSWAICKLNVFCVDVCACQRECVWYIFSQLTKFTRYDCVHENNFVICIHWMDFNEISRFNVSRLQCESRAYPCLRFGNKNDLIRAEFMLLFQFWALSTAELISVIFFFSSSVSLPWCARGCYKPIVSEFEFRCVTQNITFRRMP